MKNFNGINLEDLARKDLNIYVRLKKDFQSKFFSYENTNLNIPELSRRLSISKRRLYQWKIEIVAFPLYIGLLIIRRYSKKFSWKDFCRNICELKYGQRSKPLLINKNIFPLKKDPYYWNILFAFFCDGTSDCWSSQKNKVCINPGYTSYDKEIMDNFVDLIKTKFGNFSIKINRGSIRIPPIIDKIFKSEHKINSFNTKSKRIVQFELNKEFEKEIRSLNNDNKLGVLIRFLVDEGDKSKKSLNVRNPNITIATTSESLLKILKIILNDLNIKYHVIFRTSKKSIWKDSYTIQISRGKNRENYKLLKMYVKNMMTKYPLCKLTSIQHEHLGLILNYAYKRPIPEFTHSKIPEYIIVNCIRNKKQVILDDIMDCLKKNGLDLSINSILAILHKIPIKRNKKLILYAPLLDTHFPYTESQIKNANNYFRALELYRNGGKIAEISKILNKPWSTIRDWVYEKSKPSLLIGPWKDTAIKRGLIKMSN